MTASGSSTIPPVSVPQLPTMTVRASQLSGSPASMVMEA